MTEGGVWGENNENLKDVRVFFVFSCDNYYRIRECAVKDMLGGLRKCRRSGKIAVNNLL